MLRKIGLMVMSMLLFCGVAAANLSLGIIEEVSAVTSTYPLACGSQYEVATVNNDGSFTKISCHADFYSAKAAMQSAGDDAVVRHSASKSPTGIIAMNSGLAISYPVRSGSTTLTLSAYVDGSGKTTYVTQHREMSGAITESYDGNGNGKVYVQLNGFQGYVDLKNVDLVPMKYITNGISIWLGGNDITAANEQPFSTKIHQAYYTVVQNGNYRDLVYHAYSGYDGTVEWTFTIGRAADWMVTGTVYYSWDGYRFYSDRKYSNIAGTYYNYYQFLPVRSQSNIPASVYNQYLSNLGFNCKPSSSNFNSLSSKASQLWDEGQTFIDNQNTYGINALLIFAMACLESGNGRSRYAVERNNLFGWNAYDSDPDQASYFSSIAQAIKEQMGINIRGYADITDFRFFGSHVGNKGSGFNVKYASDPYWGMKIAAIAYEIDKTANNYNGNLTDYDELALGVINQYDASVKASASASSKTLYTTTYGNGYQENFTVVIRSSDSSWTAIQSTNGINADGSLTTHRTDGSSTGTNLNGLIAYDFERSIGYLPTSQITRINSTKTLSAGGTTPTGEFVGTVSSLSIADGKLSLAGTAYRPGIYVTESNTIKHTLKIYNEYYESVDYTLKSTVSDKDTAAYQTESLDLSKLSNGKYYFKVAVEYSSLTEYNNEFIVALDKAPDSVISSGKEYSFSIENGMLYLQVSDAKEEEPENPEKPAAEASVRYKLSTLSYLDEDNVRIEGNAFIYGLDASSDADIELTVILTEQETAEVIELDTITSDDTPINMYDGVDYTKTKFTAEFNIQDIPMGNYFIKIRVRNGASVMEEYLSSDKTEFRPQLKLTEGLMSRVYPNQSYNFRFEIIREMNTLYDETLINKPSGYLSKFTYSSFKIDDGLLNLSASAWIAYVNFDDTSKASHALYLLKEDGSIFETETKTQACEVDYGTINGSGYSLKNVCFTSQMDLTDLPLGTYIFYLDVSAGGSRDIYEATYIREMSVPEFILGNRKYTITNLTARSRVILKIEEAE